MDRNFLEGILRTMSVSGYEDAAVEYLKEYLSGYAYKVDTDPLGNTYFFVGNPGAPASLMVEAHIDEIGFQVLHIDGNGYIYVRKNGGVDQLCVPGSVVDILTRSGRIVPGVIGKKPIHLSSSDERKNAPDLESLWVDTGLSADEVKELVSVGDPVGFAPDVLFMGENRVMSKGLDDKIGVVAFADAVRKLAGKELKSSVCFVATSQEEVGCRGAVVGGERLAPAYSISVDVGFATDVPDLPAKKYGDVSLGGGVVITRHLDSNRAFSDMAVQIAEEKGIAHQISARRSATGGTNAAKIQLTGTGVRTLLLSIPNRYMHTPVEMCDLRDVEAASDLIAEIVLALDAA